MDQTGQNSDYPYNTYGYGGSTVNNNVSNSALSSSMPSINAAFNTNHSLNANPAMQNNEIIPKFDNEDFGFTLLNNLTPSNDSFNMDSQNIAPPGPRRAPTRNTQAAHTAGPIRHNPSHGMPSQVPYARPRPNSVQSPSPSQSQSHSRSQRSLTRHKSPRDMATQNATNAYTLSRTRSQSKAVQPQSQPDRSRGRISGRGEMAASSSSASGSASPFNSTDLNAPAGTLNSNISGQACGPGAIAPSLASTTTFLHPIHQNLDSSRIDPAGPQTHPNSQWRAPGPHQWVEILYDHTLLQYLSDAAIKDLLKHCDRLVGSGVQNPANTTGPAVVEGGPYTVLDAQAVWNYCTAYTKRRQQHRNNSAASRSRNNKAAQLKHWKALALAAGAPDRDFVFDINDAGNAAGAPLTLLSAVTQAAIEEMKSRWTSVVGERAGQASVGISASPGFAHCQAVEPSNQPQIQAQVFGQPQSTTQASFGRQTTAHPLTMPPQPVSAAMPAPDLKTYTATPPMTAPPISTAPSDADAYKSNDLFEEFKLDMVPLEENFLKELNATNTQDMHNGGIDFGGVDF